jgi:hypothetical protein
MLPAWVTRKHFHGRAGKKVHVLFNAGVLDFLDCSVRIRASSRTCRSLATPLKHKCMSFLPQCQYVTCKIILSSSNAPQPYPLFLSLLAIANSSFWFGTSCDAFFFFMAVISAINLIAFTVPSGVGNVFLSVFYHVFKAAEKNLE